MVDEKDVRYLAYVAFGDAEPSSQFLFLAGHAHQHGDTLAVDHDLKGLFQGDTFLQGLGPVLTHP